MHKRAVVTGATSFVGQYLLAELARRGVESYAIVRPNSAKAGDLRGAANTRLLLADMADTGRWLPEVDHADWFFHLGWDGAGAQGRADQAIQQGNIEAAQRCLEGAHQLGCTRFMFTGSQAEYGPCREVITELTPCHPVTPYGRAKLKAGRELEGSSRQMGMRFYHARIFSVYGPGDHPWTLISSCIQTFCEGKRMQLSSGQQYWNYLHVRDAACLLCGLMQSDAESGIYNIAGPDTRPLREFVEEIRKACGSGIAEYGSYAPLERPVDLRPDITKLLKEIGEVTFRNFQDEIQEMVDAYRQMNKSSNVLDFES